MMSEMGNSLSGNYWRRMSPNTGGIYTAGKYILPFIMSTHTKLLVYICRKKAGGGGKSCGIQSCRRREKFTQEQNMNVKYSRVQSIALNFCKGRLEYQTFDGG